MSPETNGALLAARIKVKEEKISFKVVIDWLLDVLPHLKDVNWEDIVSDLFDVLGEEAFNKYEGVLNAAFELVKYASVSYTDDDKYDFNEIFGIVKKVMKLISEIRKL